MYVLHQESCAHRFSHLYASMGGPGMAGSPKREKIFDLDFNEHRRKTHWLRILHSVALVTIFSECKERKLGWILRMRPAAWALAPTKAF